MAANFVIFDFFGGGRKKGKEKRGSGLDRERLLLTQCSRQPTEVVKSDDLPHNFTKQITRGGGGGTEGEGKRFTGDHIPIHTQI